MNGYSHPAKKNFQRKHRNVYVHLYFHRIKIDLALAHNTRSKRNKSQIMSTGELVPDIGPVGLQESKHMEALEERYQMCEKRSDMSTLEYMKK